MMKKFFINSLLVVFSLLISLVVAELIIRQTDLANLPDTSYHYPPDYFVADDALGYDIGKNRSDKTHALPEHPYELFSNSVGCFDYEREIPDDYAIVVGDSYTWGYAPLEKKWTTKLEELSDSFILKCGVTGYGSIQELGKAKKVAAEVGKDPKYLIVLYYYNDFNNDFLFPHSTVYKDHMVTYIDSINLDTGKVNRRSKEDFDWIYKKYNEKSFKSKFRKFYYSLVLYRAYKKAELQFKYRMKKAKLEKALADNEKLAKTEKHDIDKAKQKVVNMPTGMVGSGAHKINLESYLDEYDLDWYNKAVEDHKSNISAFITYADSIGAKLLFIDQTGALQHQRYDDFRAKFDGSENLFYYNLDSNGTKFPRWKYDGHWNIEGNQKVGIDIYNHAKKTGFFE